MLINHEYHLICDSIQWCIKKCTSHLLNGIKRNSFTRLSISLCYASNILTPCENVVKYVNTNKMFSFVAQLLQWEEREENMHYCLDSGTEIT